MILSDATFDFKNFPFKYMENVTIKRSKCLSETFCRLVERSFRTCKKLNQIHRNSCPDLSIQTHPFKTEDIPDNIKNTFHVSRQNFCLN